MSLSKRACILSQTGGALCLLLQLAWRWSMSHPHVSLALTLYRWVQRRWATTLQAWILASSTGFGAADCGYTSVKLLAHSLATRRAHRPGARRRCCSAGLAGCRISRDASSMMQDRRRGAIAPSGIGVTSTLRNSSTNHPLGLLFSGPGG